MIYIYSGEDAYESYNKALNFSHQLSEKLNSEIEIINADEVININLFLQKIEGLDMFSSSKVIIAKRLFNNKKLLEYITNYYDNFKSYEVIIWQDSKVDSKLKLYKSVLKDKNIYNFETLKEGEFKNWLINYAKNKNIFFKKEEIEYLYERVGINKWYISNEINKIEIYLTLKNKSSISKDELDELLGYSIKGDLWKFLDFFGQRNKVKTLEEFIKITSHENNFQLIIAMLARELRLIYSVKFCQKSNISLSELKLIPFILQKTIKKTYNFSIDEIKQNLKNLFELDFSIKKGEIDENTGLLLFLSNI